MKIFFIGSVKFSKRCLTHLINSKFDLIGVYTKKSSFNSDHADLTALCKTNNIPCKYVIDINSNESLEWIKILKPDIIFCFGWSRLLKAPVLNIPKMGVVGYHPSMLPKIEEGIQLFGP